jgi:hypothetical protein
LDLLVVNAVRMAAGSGRVAGREPGPCIDGAISDRMAEDTLGQHLIQTLLVFKLQIGKMIWWLRL